MLYLRDLLPAGKKVKVEYRCDGPVDEYGDTEDMLFGFAIWNGEELISGVTSVMSLIATNGKVKKISLSGS